LELLVQPEPSELQVLTVLQEWPARLDRQGLLVGLELPVLLVPLVYRVAPEQQAQLELQEHLVLLV